MATRTRKTVPVEDLKKQINMMLRDSVDEAIEGRIALAIVLERVLMDTGNYRGFRYQNTVMDFSGDSPSLTGDESRRTYY